VSKPSLNGKPHDAGPIAPNLGASSIQAVDHPVRQTNWYWRCFSHNHLLYKGAEKPQAFSSLFNLFSFFLRIVYVYSTLIQDR
jgi:hypothetical protein